MAVDTETQSTTDDQFKGGWEEQASEPITQSTPCNVLGKRHRWKDNQCVRCGIAKPERQPRQPRTDAAPRTGMRTGAFETLGSLLWAGIGLGVRYQPAVMTQPVKREDGSEIKDRPVKHAVGDAIASEAAIAGKRLDRAFQKASPTAYAIASAAMRKVTWANELAPLFLPPLFVYAMASYPKIVSKFKEQAIALLLPIFIEQAKVAEQQRKLMEQFEEVNQETIDNATRMIDAMLGINGSDSTTQTAA